MASLYIKDAETAALVARVARRQGKTKTQAVRELFQEAEAKLGPEEPKSNFVEWLHEYRRRFPAPSPTGVRHDHSVYDWMSDEEGL